MIHPASSSGKGFWHGAERSIHLLERGIQIAGTMRAGYGAAMTLTAML